MKEKKKLKKWQIALIVVAVFAVIGAVGGNSGKKSSNDKEKEVKSDPKTEEKQEEKTYHIGDMLQVGDVEYTVTAKNATATVGSEYLNKTAQNVYLVLDVTIKNNGDKALTVSDSFFKLMNGEKEYSTDSGSAIYLSDESIILKEINPDASLSGKIIFDVSQETIDAPELQLQVQTGAWGTEKGLISINQ